MRGTLLGGGWTQVRQIHWDVQIKEERIFGLLVSELVVLSMPPTFLVFYFEERLSRFFVLDVDLYFLMFEITEVSSGDKSK
jgi:hypothetical protein